MGIASALRKHAGGDLVDFSNRDPLLKALLEMAQDYYPSLLLPQEERSSFDSMPFAVRQASLNFTHRGMATFQELLRPGEPLRNLFPDDEPLLFAHSFMSRTGSGGPLHVNFLVPTLFMNGERRAWLLGSMTRKNFLKAIELELRDARLLAEGGEPTVPVVVGLMPFEFPTSWRLQTPWGVLRAPNQWEQRWGPHKADTVLEARMPMAIRRYDPTDAVDPGLKDFMKPMIDLGTSEERLRFALILSTAKDGSPPLALGPVWWLIPSPLQMNSFRGGFPEPRSSASQIKRSDSKEIRNWLRLVDDGYNPQLDLAARRLLSALTTRTQPEDGLIDAMIALESLFGTGQGEISFRLSTAVSWLLENDSESRLKRQRQVNDLYAKRSKIVHGRHLEQVAAQTYRDEAVQIAAAAFRTLFSERPELITDQERSRTLTVGGPHVLERTMDCLQRCS